jgi:hypothetical protein
MTCSNQFNQPKIHTIHINNTPELHAKTKQHAASVCYCVCKCTLQLFQNRKMLSLPSYRRDSLTAEELQPERENRHVKIKQRTVGSLSLDQYYT